MDLKSRTQKQKNRQNIERKLNADLYLLKC